MNKTIVTKKIGTTYRNEAIVRIPRALQELANINKDTKVTFSLNKKGLLEIKQVDIIKSI